MAFLPTNAAQVQQFAVALYGIKVGTATMSAVQADILAVGGLNKALNAYYAASFGSSTTAAVAATVAANLGLTGTAATDAAAYITAVLNGTSASARGEAIQGVLNLFSTLTSNATFGAAATAWNTKVEAAIAYTGASDTAVVAGAAVAGSIFNLTTGIDTPASTAGDDTYNAGALAADGVTAAVTLGVLDTINGGAGTDTLVIEAAATGNKLQGTIKNVENLTWIGGAAAVLNNNAAFAATDFSGTIKLQQTLDLAVGVTSVEAQNLVMDRVADATVFTAGYKATTGVAANLQAAAVVGDATFSVSGTALKTVNLTIDKTATGKALTVTDTGNTTEAANIAASGTAAVTVGSTALKTVTVSGAGKLTLTTGTAPATSIDTSAATGEFTSVTALATGTTFVGGAAKDTITVGATTKAIATGAGDDKVTLSVAALGAGGSVDGGDGSDTISLASADIETATSTALLGAAFAASISNFEKLEIGATAAAAAVDASRIDGITYIKSAGTGTAFTLDITNAAAGSTFETNALIDGAVSYSLKDATGTTDVVNLVFSATDGFTSVGATTIASVETLNITTLDTDAATTAPTTVFTAPITATSAKTVAVSGNVGIDLTGLTATTLTSFDASGVTATGAVGAVTITTGALAGDSILTGGAGNDTIDASAAVKLVTLNGGAGNDALTGSSTKANTINGGAGNDTIVGGSAVDTIDGGDGNDTITSGAGLDIVNFGSGNDTYVVTGNANGNTYATITGAGAGDKIDSIAGAGTATFTSAKVTLASTAAFADYLAAAAAGGAGNMKWFQYSGDTYLVHDVTAAAVFTSGAAADQVVKLAGLVDLTNSTVAAGNILTIA